MRREIEEREPARDPVLAAALRAAYADAPLAPARAAVLRRRIRARAQALPPEAVGAAAPTPDVPALGTRPLPARPRLPAGLGLRSRIWVPALLAAALAGVLLVGRERRQRTVPAPPAAIQAVGFASAEQALTANLSDTDFARVVTLEDDPAALLELAVTGAHARLAP